MPDVKNVHLTSANVEKLSRHDMLHWINESSAVTHKKIEELCSGVAYCLLMESIFPGSIGAKKIKMNAKLEHEFIFNLKLFQGAFTKLKFDKNVPIDKLVKARFQDNFEFLQWFIKFYDTHSDKENYIAPSRTASSATGSVMRKATSTTNLKSGSGNSKKPSPRKDKLSPNSGKANNSRPVSPSSLKTLNDDVNSLKEKIIAMETERDFYLGRLTQLEKLCLQPEFETDPWAKKVLERMYAEADTEQAPAGDEIEEY